MNFQKKTYTDSYDVIIVGSGIGGLTAASLLAKAGKRVLVVERNNRPGGCAQSFIRRGSIFDSAVHLVSGCKESESYANGIIYNVISLLGEKDFCSFIQIDPFYTAIFPGFKIQIPMDLEKLIHVYSKCFPKEKEGIRKLIQLILSTGREVGNLPLGFSQRDSVGLLKSFPNTIKYKNFTLSQVMNKYLTNNHANALLSAIWPYIGLPPSKVSFLYFSALLTSYIEKGVFYCKGSFQNLVEVFIRGLKKNNGTIFLNSPVSKILVKENEVKGIKLKNDQLIESSIVISNVDVTHTFSELIGFEYLPDYFVKQIKKMEESISGFIAYIVTKQDMKSLNASHEYLIFKSWDQNENYKACIQGKPGVLIVTIPTISDPSLTKEGEHIVTVVLLLPNDCVVSWKQEKTRYINLILDELQKVFPNFKDYVVYTEGATPETIKHYTNNRNGALYGWDFSPEQTGIKRLNHITPIKGLFLSGQWTRPGNGIYGVVQSGLEVSQNILGYKNINELLNALQK